MRKKSYQHYKKHGDSFLSRWFQDSKKTLHLIKKMKYSNRHIKYTYPLTGGFTFKTLSYLPRKEILRLGLELKLSWPEIQDLLVFTGHKELHLRCREDYLFIKEHLS